MTKYYLQILLNVTMVLIITLVLSYNCSSHIFNNVLNTIRYALMSEPFRMDAQTGIM